MKKERSLKPRGPKPLVCDFCYGKKAKCDRVQPTCGSCKKRNIACYYERNNFIGVSNPIKLINNSSDTNTNTNTSSTLVSPTFNVKQELFLSINFTPINYKKLIEEEVKVNEAKEDFYCGSMTVVKQRRSKKKPAIFRDNSFTLSSLDKKWTHAIRNLVQKSLFKEFAIRIVVAQDGHCLYKGCSLASYYLCTNSHLISHDSNSFKSDQNKLNSCGETIDGSILEVSKLPIFIRNQLIELYFAYINSFYPLVNPSSFFNRLRSEDTSDAFLALLSIICVCGSSYHPDKELARVAAAAFANQFSKFAKRIYSQPSVTAIQAFTICSYHISLCESDKILNRGYFFLGLAQRMCTQLGIHIEVKSSKLKEMNPTRYRFQPCLWWMISASDISVGYLFGLNYNYNAIHISPLPDIDASIISSVSFNSSSSILTEFEVTKFTPNQNAIYVSRMFKLWIIVDVVRRHLSTIPKDGTILDIHAKSKFVSQTHTCIKTLLKWYRKNLAAHDPHHLSTNNCLNLHDANLFMFFITLLTDLSKIFLPRHSSTNPDKVTDYSEIYQLHIIFQRRDKVLLDEYVHSSPRLRCAWGAALVVGVVSKFDESMLYPSSVFHWYAILQAIFLLVIAYDYVSDLTKNNKEMLPLNLPHLKVKKIIRECIEMLHSKIVKHKNRWAILKDLELVVTPFIRNRFGL